MASQTREAICLGPTRNMQGTYKFMCLTTGKVIKRRQFKEMPMPRSMIEKIEDMDKDGTNEGLTFADRNWMPFPWNNDNGDILGREEPYNQGPAEFPGIRIEDDTEMGNADDDNKEREQAGLAAENANLGVEQPQLTFRRRQVAADEQAIIQSIL